MTGVDRAAQARDVDGAIGEGVEPSRAVVDRDVGALGGPAALLDTGGVMGEEGFGGELRAMALWVRALTTPPLRKPARAT
ncbi:MAG: hypothetical protein VKO39_07655 [Cyanobacteriota bacterium]|nr:hypothetical protein [Cyanobacteriota bacterium]